VFLAQAMSGAVTPQRALSDRYVIERELGRGGMGVVYLARDVRHGRNVALKVLPPDLAGAVSAARFDREIQTLAALAHPHILPLHDSGGTDGDLFYVMQHVDGESLRQRLDRDGPLRVAEALRIACQVADALAYAHARGVIHRDIKPENILLDRRGHAYVSDFGIARVLATLPAEARLTSATVRIGSVAYMSPEQIGGEDDLDGRSDVYSLGCVIYEMLTGHPPFEDHSAHVVMRRHLVDEPARVRERRADVSQSVDAVVAAMLTKAPGQRPDAELAAGALEAEAALIAGSGPMPQLVRRRPSPRAQLVAAAAVLGAVAWLGFLRPQPPLVATRLAIAPIEWTDAPVELADGDVDVLLHQSIARWAGLDVAPVSRAPLRGVRRSARSEGAAHYIVSRAARVGDSLNVALSLHSTTDGAELRTAALRVPLTAPTLGRLRILADSLLFGRVTWGRDARSDIGTSSYPARLAYGRAHEALTRFDLAAAESLLVASTSADPGFSSAQYWLAQTRSWSGSSPEAWRGAVDRAVRSSATMEVRETALASALLALASEDYARGCAIYDSLAARDSIDFVAWYGAGDCRRLDVRVVRAPATPSGWAFRSSYHHAAAAYERALLVAPESMRMLRAEGYERARYLFFTRPRMRPGLGADGSRFLAQASLDADSLLLVPYPWDGVHAVPEPAPARIDAAMRLQRERFRRVALGWAGAMPQRSDALLAVAVSMEMGADPEASEMLRRARQLASDPAEATGLAVREIWVRMRFGAPDARELARARALADSVLAQDVAQPPSGLAAIALLAGRPARAAELARREIGADPLGLPAAVLRPAAALAVFAAAGGPPDSLEFLERQVADGIRNAAAPEHRRQARSMYLERDAFLAWPAHRFDLLQDTSLESPTARAYALFARGDSSAAMRLLRHSAADRLGLADGALSLDVAFAEAALLDALGDRTAAHDLIGGVLDQLQWMQPGDIEGISNAGALVRAMALRARLADALGFEAEATRWSNAARTLWSDGEPISTILLREMLPQS
jgi:eukaryotic-like serine/threonine-protein kinase